MKQLGVSLDETCVDDEDPADSTMRDVHAAGGNADVNRSSVTDIGSALGMVDQAIK